MLCANKLRMLAWHSKDGDSSLWREQNRGTANNITSVSLERRSGRLLEKVSSPSPGQQEDMANG